MGNAIGIIDSRSSYSCIIKYTGPLLAPEQDPAPRVIVYRSLILQVAPPTAVSFEPQEDATTSSVLKFIFRGICLPDSTRAKNIALACRRPGHELVKLRW